MDNPKILSKELNTDLSVLPINYNLIKETKKRDFSKAIEIDFYDTNNYFDLNPFYKPISNI